MVAGERAGERPNGDWSDPTCARTEQVVVLTAAR
jgi:hypothetical protein